MTTPPFGSPLDDLSAAEGHWGLDQEDRIYTHPQQCLARALETALPAVLLENLKGSAFPSGCGRMM